jgi:hypothetical protein
MVPVDTIALVVTHAGEKYTTGLRLFYDIFDNLRPPVVVFSIIQGISSNGQGTGRTKDYATMATDAILLAALYLIVLNIIGMNIKGALVDAYLASNTSRVVSLHYKFWW